ncbi:alpha/beta hydrolase [Halobacillus salinarum]|uniref:Alpha/beta hydrolase n=1 Tax=Halobacillus salinarum TaxID=2932257 RepID=A0ABY4ENF6_9BACI|nr:alpha/beta hydrolase [Halobacillus salinarum]UOQ45515.1 alpha/beta hydrolase [Halobacillus salinarum]
MEILITYLLWKDQAPFNTGKPDELEPVITPYLLDRRDKHGAVIVCPGGGYARRADHEGAPVAKWLNSIGLSAFVLDYRVFPYNHPIPLLDLQRAIRYVRYHAEKWNLDKHQIGALGFSAGGHLVSTAATQFDRGDPNSSDVIEQESSRPDMAILCYPVISFVEHYHEGSMVNLLGENATDQDRLLLSNEKNASTANPPTFLWHTADDGSVPVENSLLFAQALSKHSVPFEMHIFPNGRHGLGLAEDHDVVSGWTDLCEKWLINQEFISS